MDFLPSSIEFLDKRHPQSNDYHSNAHSCICIACLVSNLKVYHELPSHTNSSRTDICCIDSSISHAKVSISMSSFDIKVEKLCKA